MLQSTTQFNRMRVRNCTQTRVIDGAFADRQRQSHARFFRQRVKTPGKALAQIGHRLCRKQIDHAQLKQRLVIWNQGFIKLGRLPVLRFPALKNARNTAASLIARPYKTKHLVQVAISAIRLTTT